MKIDEKVSLEEIGDDYFVFLTQHDQVDMTNVLMLNKTAAWLWKQMEGRDFTREEALQALKDHYDAPDAFLESDLDNWMSTLSQQGLLLS